MDASAPTYRKIPSTASRNLGTFNSPRLEAMLGGSSALVSSTFRKATNTKVSAIKAEKNRGTFPATPCPWKMTSAVTALTRKVDTVLPMPLNALGKTEVTAIVPGSTYIANYGIPGDLKESRSNTQQENAR